MKIEKEKAKMQIPVLTYHVVHSNQIEQRIDFSNEEIIERNLYSIPLGKFKQQMEWLHQNDYKTLSLEELFYSPQSDIKKGIVLTFDDGYTCAFNDILPVLKNYKFKGLFFIITGKIGLKKYLNLEELRELKNSGMEIGSHSVSHPILTNLGTNALKNEIINSKSTLEQLLGCPVDTISIPRGFYNKRVIDEIVNAGYKIIFTSDVKYNRVKEKSYIFGRCVVRNDYNLEDFIKIIQMKKGYFIRKRIEGVSKEILKKIIGIRNFDKFKVLILKNNCND